MRWTDLTGMQWRTTSLTFCLEPSQMTASSLDKAPGTYSKGGVCSTFSAIWLTSGLLVVLPCGVSIWLTIALGAPHWLLFPLWPDCGLCQFSLVQSLGCVQLFATPWTAAHQASLSSTNSRSLLKLMSIKSVIPSNHLILCRPLLLLPLILPSISVFSNELVCHFRWPKY